MYHMILNLFSFVLNFRKKSRPFTIHEMNIMLTEKTSAEVLQRISQENDSLKNLLDDITMDSQMIKIVLKIVKKSLDHSIISQPLAINFVIHTLMNSNNFITKLGEKVSKEIRFDHEAIESLLYIMDKCLQKLPDQGVQVFSFLEKVLNSFIHELYKDDYKIQEIYKSVQDMMQAPFLQIENEETPNRKPLQAKTEVDESFRQLCIFPTETDLDPGEDLQLRANKITGCYDDVNDYLDVQVCKL